MLNMELGPQILSSRSRNIFTENTRRLGRFASAKQCWQKTQSLRVRSMLFRPSWNPFKMRNPTACTKQKIVFSKDVRLTYCFSPTTWIRACWFACNLFLSLSCFEHGSFSLCFVENIWKVEVLCQNLFCWVFWNSPVKGFQEKYLVFRTAEMWRIWSESLQGSRSHGPPHSAGIFCFLRKNTIYVWKFWSTTILVDGNVSSPKTGPDCVIWSQRLNTGGNFPALCILGGTGDGCIMYFLRSLCLFSATSVSPDRKSVV